MKIAIVLIGIVLAAALVVSATMGAESLVPGGDSKTSKVPRSEIKTNGKARLMPASFAPPTLKGTNFKAGENVTVKLEGLKTKRVEASSAGTFTVRFPSRVDRCNGMTATAVGDKGSRAAFQLSEFMCASSGTQQ